MKRLLFLPIVLILVLACSMTPTPQVVVVTATPVQPSPVVPTATPQVIIVTATPEPATATPYPTYTPYPTNTPFSTPTTAQGNMAQSTGAPTVTVSIDTQCRIGPGKEYIQLSGLVVGKTAKVVGKNTDGSYWIIKNPTDIGNCWLWGEYATVTGDTSNLKIFEEPDWLKNFAFRLVVTTWPDLVNLGKCNYQAHLIGFPNNMTITHAVRQRIQGDWSELYSPKDFNTGNEGADFFIFSNLKIKGDLLVTTISATVNGAKTLLVTSVDEPNCK